MFTLIQVVVFTGTFVVTSWFIALWNGKKKKSGLERRLPPSLPSLPIVGSLPFIKEPDALPEFFTKIADKLGPIFTLRFGSRFTVVLSNRESIEDALLRHSSSFSGRKLFYTEKYNLNRRGKGIVFRNYDAEFKRLHKLVLSIMKDLGLGSRNQLEMRILTEVSELIRHLRNVDGEVFDPAEITILSTSNVPINIMFGRRREYKDGMTEEVYQMRRWVAAIDIPVDIFPMLRFFPPYRRRFNELSDSSRKLHQAIDMEIDRSSLDAEATDCFVRKYIEKEGLNYEREQLLYTLRDLLGGSTDTTATTILWFIVFIANNSQVAERLQKDIDSVVPRDRLPTMDDQSRLPYVEATILEVLRHRSPLPMAVPHFTLHDTEVLGYFIPADTVVTLNLRAAHMNKTDWSDPDVFRPERFLDENNKLINKNSVIPFSLGRRSCPGEILAREQLFLFLSGLMQNFHIRPPENTESVTVETIYSLTVTPSPFKIRMIPRNV